MNHLLKLQFAHQRNECDLYELFSFDSFNILIVWLYLLLITKGRKRNNFIIRKSYPSLRFHLVLYLGSSGLWEIWLNNFTTGNMIQYLQYSKYVAYPKYSHIWSFVISYDSLRQVLLLFFLLKYSWSAVFC